MALTKEQRAQIVNQVQNSGLSGMKALEYAEWLAHKQDVRDNGYWLDDGIYHCDCDICNGGKCICNHKHFLSSVTIDGKKPMKIEVQ